jgi:uncharacterized damage-inducible protein DinB
MKRALFLFLLPALLAAQEPVAPAKLITSTMGSFAALYAGWLTAAFDSVPESKYSYKPTPAQRSIGDIAQHLEHANYLLCAHFGGIPYRMTAKDSLADTIKARWPKDTLTARLKASLAFCQRAYATLDDAKLADMLPPVVPTPEQRLAPRARFVMLFITDLTDHWSQIANYMRLLGMTPPSALKH